MTDEPHTHDDAHGIELAALDVDRADLRADGLGLGARRRTLLQSLSSYAPGGPE